MNPPSASPWETAPPVLFNPYKHHAGALRHHIAAAARADEPGLLDLARRLVVVGAELMDLYMGALTPAEIGARVVAALQADNRLAPDAFGAWLAEAGGYRVLTFPEDASRWVLRAGEAGGRYVHVHPGRWSPETRRVKANVLKTAVLVLAHAAVHGDRPTDVAVVNHVRARYLGLSPIRDLSGEGGLGAVLRLLEARPDLVDSGTPARPSASKEGTGPPAPALDGGFNA